MYLLRVSMIYLRSCDNIITIHSSRKATSTSTALAPRPSGGDPFSCFLLETGTTTEVRTTAVGMARGTGSKGLRRRCVQLRDHAIGTTLEFAHRAPSCILPIGARPCSSARTTPRSTAICCARLARGRASRSGGIARTGSGEGGGAAGRRDDQLTARLAPISPIASPRARSRDPRPGKRGLEKREPS